ncbi:MAG: TonB family protein [Bacteroidota bacterium]|nr:TonB family protein [Bacteroidota bacterium]
MAQKINIYTDQWCEVVFEGKNHTYGAYVLRKFRDKRHRLAVITTFIFFFLAFMVPTLLTIIAPKAKTRNIEVTALSNIEQEKDKKEPPKLEKPPEEIKSSIKFTPPVIAPDDQVKEEMKSQDQLTEAKVDISIADVVGNDKGGTDIAEVQKKVVIEEEEKPLLVVEQNPEFQGGYDAMLKFLHDKMQYPTLAQESGIQGTVFVQFVVSKTGKISNVKVLRGIGGGCDEEAVRVVREMPNWIPGRQNGQAVPVMFQIPVKFQLQMN